MNEPLRPSAPALKSLRRLSRRRSSRNEQDRFLLDGPVLLREALECGALPETVYFEPEADRPLITSAQAAGALVVEVAQGALAKVLDVANPQSVVSVLPKREVSPQELRSVSLESGRPLLVLVGVQDPGNAGTLVRVAEAAGCAGLLFSEGSVDPWNPKAVRASAGSVLRVPIGTGVANADLVELAGTMTAQHGERSVDVGLVATVAHSGRAPDEVDLSGANLILIGSEAHGLPDEMIEASQVTVSVPMEGAAESLNAAVSGALVAFEAARQRRQLPD